MEILGQFSPEIDNRSRFKAQIVLMAADGAATRAIGRALDCTTGTASKWRVRYAKDRLAGFSEVGNRGAEAKYNNETDRRILALTTAGGIIFSSEPSAAVCGPARRTCLRREVLREARGAPLVNGRRRHQHVSARFPVVRGVG